MKLLTYLFRPSAQRVSTCKVLPRSLARRFEKTYPIRVFEPPIAYPPLRLILLWPRSRDTDPALRWFLAEVRESFSQLRQADGV